jgi:hypothetical protein
MQEGLEIRYQNERVENPNVAALEIYNTRRDSIPSESFDKDRGLIFGIAAPIIRVLAVDHKPSSAPTPHVNATKDGLELKPELIVAKETITVSLLTEGPVKDFSVSLNPLNNVKVDIRDRETWQKQQTRWQTVAGATVVLAVLVSVYFLLTSLGGCGPTSLEPQLQQIKRLVSCAALKADTQTTASRLGDAYDLIRVTYNDKRRDELLAAAHYNAMLDQGHRGIPSPCTLI